MSDKQSKRATSKPAPRAKKPTVRKAGAHPRKAATPQLSEEELLAQAEAKPLSQSEELFVQAFFAKGMNATQAYLAVHPQAKNSTARTEGCKTLAKPHVARRVADIAAERAKKFEIEGDELLREAHAIAHADHRHLTQYVYRCCRYCHGIDHKFQRTVAEMDRDRAEHQKAERKREAACILKNKPFTETEFDELGGLGFNEWLDPHPECPSCHGKGKGRMEIADTRHIPPEAAILFAGVEETKDGLKVKMHDKGKALDMLFRNKGLYEKDNAQQAAATSPEALAALAAAMEAGRAKQLEVLAGRRGSGFTGD